MLLSESWTESRCSSPVRLIDFSVRRWDVGKVLTQGIGRGLGFDQSGGEINLLYWERLLGSRGPVDQMLKIGFDSQTQKSILCLGAHCDDIEIGCGGTISKLISTVKDISIYWVVFSSDERRTREALRSANDLLRGAKRKNIVINQFRTSFFPYQGVEIKEYFERLKQEFSPDIVFTHYRNDLHQDHRTISELTWNTFRDHLILEYEIPKFDGDLGSPNFFVHLDKAICQKKIARIVSCYRSQSDKAWFTEDTFWSILRLRGIESNAPEKYAEGFYCRKMVVF